MLTEEAQTLARHAKATWPTMNAETAGSLAADLRELDVRMAKCALAEMKAECTYFSFTEFSQRYSRHKQAARKARQEAEREAEAHEQHDPDHRCAVDAEPEGEGHGAAPSARRSMTASSSAPRNSPHAI